ncbi:MAG TPA: hypothetical protein VK896_03095, partial [Gaiellaceae bacterium]|nr:hypothetical protein [Gaiellaceae bacterium]
MGTCRPGLIAVALAVLAGASVAARTGGAQTDDCTPRPSPAYSARIEAGLRSGRDVWGERLLAARGGPTLAAASSLIAPLLHARTAQGQGLTRTGVHYVPFSIPDGAEGASDAMLHLADGSQVLAGRVSGQSLDVLVGETGREAYGSCLLRVTPARLASRWLPILRTAYRDVGGSRYAQESFAGRYRGRLAA